MRANSNRGYPNYACVRRSEGRGCTQPFASTRIIDPQVKAAIEAALTPYVHPELRKAAKANLDRQSDKLLSNDQVRKRQLEAAKQRLSGAQLNLTRLYAEGRIQADHYEGTMAQYESQVTSVEAELLEVGSVTAPDYGPMLQFAAAIGDRLTASRHGWADLSVTAWRELMEATIERVTLNNKIAEVVFVPDVKALHAATLLQGANR